MFNGRRQLLPGRGQFLTLREKRIGGRLACGVTPEAMAKAMASSSATMPTVTPAVRSAVKSCRV